MTTLSIRILICVVFGLIGWRHFVLAARSTQNPQGEIDGAAVRDGLVIAAICLVFVGLAIFVPSDWCSRL